MFINFESDLFYINSVKFNCAPFCYFSINCALEVHNNNVIFSANKEVLVICFPFSENNLLNVGYAFTYYDGS